MIARSKKSLYILLTVCLLAVSNINTAPASNAAVEKKLEALKNLKSPSNNAASIQDQERKASVQQVMVPILTGVLKGFWAGKICAPIFNSYPSRSRVCTLWLTGTFVLQALTVCSDRIFDSMTSNKKDDILRVMNDDSKPIEQKLNHIQRINREDKKKFMQKIDDASAVFGMLVAAGEIKY